MKKLSTYLFLILFSFSAPSFADDIRDLKIEGISIGDSLLDHLAKEEIITEIERTKPTFKDLTDDFGEVFLFGKFEIYEDLSFFVKPDDENYTIYSITGEIKYDDKIEQCYAKQKEIGEEFSALYKNARKFESTTEVKIGDKVYFDDSGTNYRLTSLVFDSGDIITVHCYNYEKGIDFLLLKIFTKEVQDWFGVKSLTDTLKTY